MKALLWRASLGLALCALAVRVDAQPAPGEADAGAPASRGAPPSAADGQAQQPPAAAPAPATVEPPVLEGEAELELPEGATVPESGVEVILSIDETGAVSEATL
ncbi:MAG TPA: hypothetical protein VMF89_18970, partial [Polyangiales bacterium]|nr:hypothetical protein [Polyangiales bacterium]